MNIKKEDVMKNLFVILAVLAVVSMASAGTISLVPSATLVDSGTIITISLIADSDVTGLTIDAIKDNAANTQNQGGYTMASILTVGRALGGTLNNGSLLLEYVGGSISAPGQKVLAGAVIWSMDYKVVGADNQVITISTTFDDESYFEPLIIFNDNSSTGTVGSAQVTLTPEPMTIALLGLGGLFLRRKLS